MVPIINKSINPKTPRKKRWHEVGHVTFGPSCITYVAAEHHVQQAKMFAQFVVNEMKKRFPTDSIIHALAVFDWRSLPNEDVPAEQFGRQSISQLIPLRERT